MQMNFFMKSNKNMYTFIPLESKKIVYNLCKSIFHNSHILANMAENGDIWKKYCAAHSDFFFLVKFVFNLLWQSPSSQESLCLSHIDLQ